MEAKNKKEINPDWRSDKVALGKLLYAIRQRHQLVREEVSESINMSMRNLYAIEVRYNTSLDEIIKLFTFYYQAGYATEEDETNFLNAMLRRENSNTSKNVL